MSFLVSPQLIYTDGMYIALLGRQPDLSLAELEALFGAKALRPLSSELCFLDVSHDDLQPDRLGGTIKLMEVVSGPIDTPPQRLLQDFEKYLLSHLKADDGQKVTIGLSAFDINLSTKQLTGNALQFKKMLKQLGHGVRVVPNKTVQLSTAQILHNKLAEPAGLELNIVAHNKDIYLAKTVWVQDINAYTARDQARPMRDARVGMLPPKLAQIMINLVGDLQPPVDHTQARLLDPFCGTGVVLQEAALMHYALYGTDISERMVRYSRDNINWLQEKYAFETDWHMHEGDATTTTWQQPIDLVVCEMYLGQPFATVPPQERIELERRDCNQLLKNFLKNISTQIQPGTRLSLAVPSWHINKTTFLHLSVLSELESLGFTRMHFSTPKNVNLLYFREEQVVARELIVLEKK
jgi:tRNA G10  N-methylase Trm11